MARRAAQARGVKNGGGNHAGSRGPGRLFAGIGDLILGEELQVFFTPGRT